MYKLRTLFNQETVTTVPQPQEVKPPKLKVGKTPIEIALGIDEEGRTTARKLYGFLELHAAAYSRWCRSNITENDFAEEGVDYWSINTDVERNEGKYNPKPTTDYALTATFAKKLAMTSNSEKGEQAREYFIRVEEQLKMIAERIREQQAPAQQITVQQRVTLDDIFMLDEIQAQTRYNLGRNRLKEVADKAGAVVRVGNRKNGYLRKRLDEYFELLAR